MFIRLVLADSLKPLHPQVHFPTSLARGEAGTQTAFEGPVRRGDTAGLPLSRE